MLLDFPAEPQPVVWGMETSMTAEATPFRSPPCSGLSPAARCAAVGYPRPIRPGCPFKFAPVRCALGGHRLCGTNGLAHASCLC